MAPRFDIDLVKVESRGSFRPPFSKGGTDPTPWGVGRRLQTAKSSHGVSLLIAFLFALTSSKRKAGKEF